MEARQKSANLSKYERWINQYAIFVNIYRETARHDAEEHYERKALISRSLAAGPNKYPGFEVYASDVEKQISNILNTDKLSLASIIKIIKLIEPTVEPKLNDTVYNTPTCGGKTLEQTPYLKYFLNRRYNNKLIVNELIKIFYKKNSIDELINCLLILVKYGANLNECDGPEIKFTDSFNLIKNEVETNFKSNNTKARVPEVNMDELVVSYTDDILKQNPHNYGDNALLCFLRLIPDNSDNRAILQIYNRLIENCSDINFVNWISGEYPLLLVKKKTYIITELIKDKNILIVSHDTRLGNYSPSIFNGELITQILIEKSQQNEQRIEKNPLNDKDVPYGYMTLLLDKFLSLEIDLSKPFLSSMTDIASSRIVKSEINNEEDSSKIKEENSRKLFTELNIGGLKIDFGKTKRTFGSMLEDSNAVESLDFFKSGQGTLDEDTMTRYFDSIQSKYSVDGATGNNFTDALQIADFSVNIAQISERNMNKTPKNDKTITGIPDGPIIPGIPEMKIKGVELTLVEKIKLFLTAALETPQNPSVFAYGGSSKFRKNKNKKTKKHVGGLGGVKTMTQLLTLTGNEKSTQRIAYDKIVKGIVDRHVEKLAEITLMYKASQYVTKHVAFLLSLKPILKFIEDEIITKQKLNENVLGRNTVTKICQVTSSVLSASLLALHDLILEEQSIQVEIPDGSQTGGVELPPELVGAFEFFTKSKTATDVKERVPVERQKKLLELFNSLPKTDLEAYVAQAKQAFEEKKGLTYESMTENIKGAFDIFEEEKKKKDPKYNRDAGIKQWEKLNVNVKNKYLALYAKNKKKKVFTNFFTAVSNAVGDVSSEFKTGSADIFDKFTSNTTVAINIVNEMDEIFSQDSIMDYGDYDDDDTALILKNAAIIGIPIQEEDSNPPGKKISKEKIYKTEIHAYPDLKSGWLGNTELSDIYTNETVEYIDICIEVTDEIIGNVVLNFPYKLLDFLFQIRTKMLYHTWNNKFFEDLEFEFNYKETEIENMFDTLWNNKIVRPTLLYKAIINDASTLTPEQELELKRLLEKQQNKGKEQQNKGTNIFSVFKRKPDVGITTEAFFEEEESDEEEDIPFNQPEFELEINKKKLKILYTNAAKGKYTLKQLYSIKENYLLVKEEFDKQLVLRSTNQSVFFNTEKYKVLKTTSIGDSRYDEELTDVAVQNLYWSVYRKFSEIGNTRSGITIVMSGITTVIVGYLMYIGSVIQTVLSFMAVPFLAIEKAVTSSAGWIGKIIKYFFETKGGVEQIFSVDREFAMLESIGITGVAEISQLPWCNYSPDTEEINNIGKYANAARDAPTIPIGGDELARQVIPFDKVYKLNQAAIEADLIQATTPSGWLWSWDIFFAGGKTTITNSYFDTKIAAIKSWKAAAELAKDDKAVEAINNFLGLYENAKKCSGFSLAAAAHLDKALPEVKGAKDSLSNILTTTRWVGILVVVGSVTACFLACPAAIAFAFGAMQWAVPVTIVTSTTFIAGWLWSAAAALHATITVISSAWILIIGAIVLWLNTYIYGIMKLQANYCSKIDRKYSQLYINKKYNVLAPFRGFLWFLWRYVYSKAIRYLKGWYYNGICACHFALVTCSSMDMAGTLNGALKVESPASWRDIFNKTRSSTIKAKVTKQKKKTNQKSVITRALNSIVLRSGKKVVKKGGKKISKRRRLLKRNKLTKRLKKH